MTRLVRSPHQNWNLSKRRHEWGEKTGWKKRKARSSSAVIAKQWCLERERAAAGIFTIGSSLPQQQISIKRKGFLGFCCGGFSSDSIDPVAFRPMARQSFTMQTWWSKAVHPWPWREKRKCPGSHGLFWGWASSGLNTWTIHYLLRGLHTSYIWTCGGLTMIAET